jgi:aspartyl-tRNA(Asn)/glutamyl-tRNA(Gln) amidotransferase subunit A
MPGPLFHLPVHSLIDALARREVSPVELVDGYLERLDRLNGKFHAYLSVYASEARRSAAEAEKAIRSGSQIGPFHGIPIAIKDIVEMAGTVTTGGSAIWRERVSSVTATLVRKLAAAGVIVLGKTHTVEFAFGGWGTNQHLGTPWNPWDLRSHRCPGGSSSGSGAAVAAGLAPWAIGSDTGGSVRLPASFCGVVGLKTTIGRISTAGILPLAETFDTPGPITRSVEDAALLFNLLQGPDPLDPRTLFRPADDPRPGLKRGVAGIRMAVLPEAERGNIDSEVVAAYDAAVALLAEAGAHIVEAPLPRRVADYARLCEEIMFAEGYSHMAGIVDRDDLPLDQDVRARFLQGKDLLAADYLQMLRQREVMKRDFEAAFADIDVLLTPTTAMPAIPLEAIDQKLSPARFTRMANCLDRCALALPCGFTRGGLPVSLQIIGRGYDEATALRAGWAYEQATPWHRQIPPDA